MQLSVVSGTLPTSLPLVSLLFCVDLFLLSVLAPRGRGLLHRVGRCKGCAETELRETAIRCMVHCTGLRGRPLEIKRAGGWGGQGLALSASRKGAEDDFTLQRALAKGPRLDFMKSTRKHRGDIESHTVPGSRLQQDRTADCQQRPGWVQCVTPALLPWGGCWLVSAWCWGGWGAEGAASNRKQVEGECYIVGRCLFAYGQTGTGKTHTVRSPKGWPVSGVLEVTGHAQ